MTRLHELSLGLRADAFVQEQQSKQARQDSSGGMRSARTSQKQREWYDKYATN